MKEVSAEDLKEINFSIICDFCNNHCSFCPSTKIMENIEYNQLNTTEFCERIKLFSAFLKEHSYERSFEFLLMDTKCNINKEVFSTIQDLKQKGFNVNICMNDLNIANIVPSSFNVPVLKHILTIQDLKKENSTEVKCFVVTRENYKEIVKKDNVIYIVDFLEKDKNIKEDIRKTFKDNNIIEYNYCFGKFCFNESKNINLLITNGDLFLSCSEEPFAYIKVGYFDFQESKMFLDFEKLKCNKQCSFK